ncbi:MAG TPA: ferritin-like domain-containing protein [Pyrinomonadaceae bacterium]|nr:ferritin-like domain-containing protein [Pyrinomonadaceae bacterium]
MTFETNKDVLDWYEKQPRTLDEKFIGNIDWNSVKDYPLDEKFVPVLLYMRDVETLTDVYYDELRRTPTGKDPIISKFMERWSCEEQTHGELLNRFLNEAGIPTEDKWQKQVLSSVSTSYTVTNYLITTLTNLVGKRFTATHMAFGAIHEMSTTQGYRRLIDLADHPVLSEILRGIVREESAHTTFYRSVARIELEKSEISRRLSRFLIKHFWTPVGSGAKSKRESDYTITTLFSGDGGLDWIDKNVTQRIQGLPGFDGLTKVSDKIGQIVSRHASIV